MKTEGFLSPGQAEAGRQMRLLAKKFDMKALPFPLRARRLPLGLGIGVGFCVLPGRKVAMGFASKGRLAPLAVAEGNVIRPVKKLKDLAKGIGDVTLGPDRHGGKIASIRDPFGSPVPVGQLRKEGGKWGLEDIRIPLPKTAVNSLSLPAALSTLFMGDYLPSVLSGFPVCSPTGSVLYHFFTQNAGSAISSVLEDAKACRDFSLASSGYEIATALAIKESGLKEAVEGDLSLITSSCENDSWTFSSPLEGAEKALKKFESFMNLAYFAGDSSPYPFGFWEFLDAMEEGLEDPLSHSRFKEVPAMLDLASGMARRLKRGALDPDGEWVSRDAFLAAAGFAAFPMPVSYSISFASPQGKAALVLQAGASWRIPEFLAPHPLGRRRLLFLFSLAVAKTLCAAAFGAESRLEELDLFIETREGSQSSDRPLLLAKGSFSREEFLRPEEGEGAEEFFKARFKGDLARSPYFSPIPSEREWARPPFASSIRRKPPEFNWEEVPRKFIPALGTSFIADLSADRQLVLMRAMGALQSISDLARAGKMGKEEAEERLASICRLIPDPEISRVGSELSACIASGLPEGGVYIPRLQGRLEALRREARRILEEEGRIGEAARLLERGVLEAEEGFDKDPMAPSRYFHSYLERVVYNRLRASTGEYTVLLPSGLFAAHLELEELFSRQKDPRALEHANWQVIHAPATPLAHLNQYKEFSAAKDWVAARAAAMNMLEVSVEAKEVAIAYRNLGYCFWMEGDIPLASALYRMAESVNGKDEMIRAEGRLLEAAARSSHILLPTLEESKLLLKGQSIPDDYRYLPAIGAAREAAEALVDCGLFLPAAAVLNSLATLPEGATASAMASTLFF